jgi:hypothetical protein
LRARFGSLTDLLRQIPSKAAIAGYHDRLVIGLNKQPIENKIRHGWRDPGSAEGSVKAAARVQSCDACRPCAGTEKLYAYEAPLVRVDHQTLGSFLTPGASGPKQMAGDSYDVSRVSVNSKRSTTA